MEHNMSEPASFVTNDVVVTVTPAAVSVHSPFDPEWVEEARKLAGKWNSRAWVFDPRHEDRVRAALGRIYGTDGTPVPGLTILAEVPKFVREFAIPGRKVAHRPGRDSRVSLGIGVSVVAGEFPAQGGSAKHPSVDAWPGTVVEITDLPATLLSRYEQEDWFRGARVAAPPETIPEVSAQDPCAEISDAVLIAAIEMRGYRVSPIEH